jgi:hypothetical protein
MRAAVFIAPFALCSCIGISIGPSSSSNNKDAGSSTTSSDGSTEDASVVGANCGVDPDTGITLCLAISTCPTLVVDPDLFPGCGFRIHAASDVIDLECACYGQICPIGVTTTCDQAAALMVDQSQYTVCMQVNEGRCTIN